MIGIGSLFSGIGGLERGIEAALPDARVVWQAESDPHARAVLAHHYPETRRYNDVRQIDDEAPPVDLICGGFPCQDISLAGAGAGIDGPRSGLWSMTSPPCWLTPQGRIVDAPADVQARAEAELALDALGEAGDDAERQMTAAIAFALGGLLT